MTRLKCRKERLQQMDGEGDDDGEADDEEDDEEDEDFDDEEKRGRAGDELTGDHGRDDRDQVQLNNDKEGKSPSSSDSLQSYPQLSKSMDNHSGSDVGHFPQNEQKPESLLSDKEEGKNEEKKRYLLTLEAKEIYILMSKEYRISRNRRAEWFFNNVNTCLDFPSDEKDDFSEDEGSKLADQMDNGSSDFEVVSIIPCNPPSEWTFENRHSYKYHVNPDTVITYLSRRYRIVFCLDISPSVASVDVQAGGVVFDSIFRALQASLHGLLQPFQIPGSKRTFRPEIFLTVIAHTPFFTPVTDQVLIQGQMLDKETCSNIIRHIFEKLNDIENRIARLISKRVHQLSLNNLSDFNEDFEDNDEVDVPLEEPDNHSNGDPGEDRRLDGLAYPKNSKYTSFSMSPDFGLLDLLRQALIAMSLMPENSSAGLVILTDGVISVPDGRYLDIILSQLRYNTVSCSFIQLSSPFHPHLCHGVLPYADLMKFIASATFGAFLSEAPEINDTTVTGMNVYHNAFLAWSFHKTLETEWTNPRPPANVKPGEWSVRNKCFFSVRDMPIVKKQQYENVLNVDHMKVMSCRLREGFTIKEVITSPETGLSEVTLILPWKFLIHLEYKILISTRDYMYGDIRLGNVTEAGSTDRVRCVVSLEGPYDFLHDVTCLAKKPFSSLYRQLMVNRFWATRKNLSESDRLLVHLNSFSANTAYYNIPDSLKNGMPLFYWSSAISSANPQLHSNEMSFSQFTHFWKPVCLLDTTVWQKWMHTHRIGVILEHDYPLPKNLYLPNSTGRFNVIQCRQAIMALNTLLKNMSSFVLLENQSYVHLMFRTEEEKVPHSFCLIRVTSKPPHVVLRLAFLVGTPGHLRHRTVAQFREKIRALTFPQRVKDPPKWRVIINTPVMAKAATTASPLVNKTSWSELPCCAIVHKPVEKILIRYDKSPEDFRKRLLSREKASFLLPEGKSGQPRQSTFGFRPTYQHASVGNTTSYQMLPEVFNTIARYLHHKRWIWWFPGGDLPPLNIKWASEILATVTKIRLQEGFRFAYSSAGITNMVLELPMANESSTKTSVTPMVLQFLLFPPTTNLKSDYEDFDSFDASKNLFLVTECWVEPQCGRVTDDNSGSDLEDIPVVSKNFLGLDYFDIPKLLNETDHKCISLVGTFEYLVRICSHKDAPFLISVNQSLNDIPIIEEHESIQVIPFEFDLKQILMRSGQVEILFSSFFQDLSLTFPNEWNVNVCSFFERANNVLYQHWCNSIASSQDKEVKLTADQHEVASKSVLHRKGLENIFEEELPNNIQRGTKIKNIQWRCFVQSKSNTHVLLTIIPASLKDLKHLLLMLDSNMEGLHKTKSSRYVDLLDYDCTSASEIVMECPNKIGGTAQVVSSTSSSSSPHLYDHHQQNCRNCQQNASRKRVRAFSGGSECAPAVKKYMKTPSQTMGPPGDEENVSSAHGPQGSAVESTTTTELSDIGNMKSPEEQQAAATIRSQTFSEGTASGKLAQFMKAKRTLSDQSGGAGTADHEQDNICVDPLRCSQLNEYLNRCGLPADDSRYVPCRPPILGSIACCLFTFSCSLMSLTEHVVFKKLSREETTRDFRSSKDSLLGGVVLDDFDVDTGDDDDDESSGSGTMFPNGRSISQESFSESSLQRLEAAEHESLLKQHYTQLRQNHLQAYISSAYRSLLSGYPMLPCDIQMVIDKCALTRVRFPLDNFLHYVCRHEKSLTQVLSELQQGEVQEPKNPVDENTQEDKEKEHGKSCSLCNELDSIHQFIRKRFRKLLSRNFMVTMENSHILFYKLLGSNALSDVSGLGVKCSSDFEDNLDSCSVAADSLCSVDEPYPNSSLHIIPSDTETADRSPGPLRRINVTHLDGRHATNMDDQQSCGGMTASSLATQCAPLFCYVTCGFQISTEEKTKGAGEIEQDDVESLGFIPLLDMPTCYHKLCTDYFKTMAREHPESELSLSPDVKFKLTLELTFLTCPDFTPPEQPVPGGKPEPPVGIHPKTEYNKFNLNLSDFKKRLSIRQSRSIEHIIQEVNWLMADEITSFRGGAGSTGSGSTVDADVLEKIAHHVEISHEKPGCQFQQIQLRFVEPYGEKGFQSFLDRCNNLSVNEFSFRRVGMWWYLVKVAAKMDSPEDSLPPFWIILRASSNSLLHLYHHCRYDENDISTLTFSRNLRVNVVDLITNEIRTINQDLLLQQLHDTRMCSPLLEKDDTQDLDEVSSMDIMMMPGVTPKFGDAESDVGSTVAGSFCRGMFSCQVVWVTTFDLHSRLRSGGGKTAFARGIQTLRSTLTAFEVLNRKNMFVYRDATGNVFYMRFYRGVDVLETSNPSQFPLDNTGGGGGDTLDECSESGMNSLMSDSSNANNRTVIKRARNQDSESEKSGRDDAFDGKLALKVHGIVPAGEEIKEQLVQSLRNKLDDAVLDILSVTLMRNPHCKLTPEDVHFLQEPRSKPDSVFRFSLTSFIASGHLPAFSYYLHQNLLQFLSMPKYTNQKPKYHFQDYSRLQEDREEMGEQSSVYLYNQSPGGGGTGNRGIAVVSMAMTDKLGNLVKNPEWRQPELGSEFALDKLQEMIHTKELSGEEGDKDVGIMVEFSMWMQGRINLDLLKGHVDQAIKQAGWDLLMEFKLMTAPLSTLTTNLAEDDLVFEPLNADELTKSKNISGGQITHDKVKMDGAPPALPERRRRSSHLNPTTTRSNGSCGLVEEDDEPRMRSMSFTGLRKSRTDGEGRRNEPGRAPSPVSLIPGRGAISEGSRPRILPRTQSNQMSLTSLETGEIGKLHPNYTEVLDNWLEKGTTITAPSLRRIVVPLNCRYPVHCIVQELEKIINLVAPDNAPRQFWKMGETTDFLTYGNSGGGRRDSGGDEYSRSTAEYGIMRKHERELLALEQKEEAEYPVKILKLFRRNENFQPGYTGHVCYLIARNLAHWKCCLNCDVEFSLHTSQDFKNLYKYPPLLNENFDIDGSRGSIEKLPRVSFGREFILWNGSKGAKPGGTNSSPILIPRQRFLRAKVTCSEVDFVVYNWSKECCERLQEQVGSLSNWIQARASLLSSLLLQKSGLFYCQPILPDNFASPSLNTNQFVTGDVDLKDLILNTQPVGKHERRNPVTTGRLKPLIVPPAMKSTQVWEDFYRNMPLCNILRMPEPVGENPVDAHGRQLLNFLNHQGQNKDTENSFFQYWLTRGPSASNVITTQVLESFKQAARTIHFCLTPVMFLPTWRAAVAQTRDSSSSGGIIRRNRGSSRRFFQTHTLHPPSKVSMPPHLLQAQRVRHGSEASQASSLSLRNRSRSYHSGMPNLFVSDKDLEGSPGSAMMSISPQMQQQQNLFLKVRTDEPWHAVLCRTILQEYMQYLQTLGFVPVHCKPAGTGSNPNSPSPSEGGGRGGGIIKPKASPATASPMPSPLASSTPTPAYSTRNIKQPGATPGTGVGVTGGVKTLNIPVAGNANQAADADNGEDDERMIHFLQRCLTGGIIVIEVGLLPPFFYCKIHALEAKRITPSRNGKAHGNSSLMQKNAVQFVDECEKMKILTHLHSFMYDFHLRAMYLYISGKQLLFKNGYHITTFLDDFITYYQKSPNFSRNAVHIGMVTLEEVMTPSQVLFNYILSHDKYYRMKVIRMTPYQSGVVLPEDNSSEYVLVHHMSRKVSYRSSEREVDQGDAQQTQDEFDLTLVIAHDYPTSSRDFVPDYQGLRVKYYIVLTSRRELYPKGDAANESNNGKLCPVNTPEPLCTRHHASCSASNCPCLSNVNSGAYHKLVSPPAPPPSLHEGHQHFHGHHQHSSAVSRRPPQLPDYIREERVRYMGYFSSHDQLMQKIIDEQKDTMEQFIRQLITKAAVDCRRDLLWQRLLIGRPHPEQTKKGGRQSRSTSASVVSAASLKEDIISRETVGPLYYSDFNELLGLVQVIPLKTVDPRLEKLLHQTVSFYQSLIKVLIGSSSSGTGSSSSATSSLQNPQSSQSQFNYREFVSPDHQVHQLAIFTQDAHKSIVMVQVNTDRAQCDIFVVFKDGKKQEQSRASSTDQPAIPPLAELGDPFFTLVEKVVNACCYTTWTSLI